MYRKIKKEVGGSGLGVLNSALQRWIQPKIDSATMRSTKMSIIEQILTTSPIYYCRGGRAP